MKLREAMSEKQTAMYDTVKECNNRLSDVIYADLLHRLSAGSKSDD